MWKSLVLELLLEMSLFQGIQTLCCEIAPTHFQVIAADDIERKKLLYQAPDRPDLFSKIFHKFITPRIPYVLPQWPLGIHREVVLTQ